MEGVVGCDVTLDVNELVVLDPRDGAIGCSAQDCQLIRGSWLRTTFGRQSATMIDAADSGSRAPDSAADDEGRVRLRVTAPSEAMLARGLAGWGRQVEVLGPESVRAELGQIGAELVRGNG